MDLHIQINRRQCLIQGLGAVAATALPRPVDANASPLSFRLRFVLASAMYGYGDLESILPEVKKTGANAIDIWPKVHGNQREQIEAMGEARFKSLLNEHARSAVLTEKRRHHSISRTTHSPRNQIDSLALGRAAKHPAILTLETSSTWISGMRRTSPDFVIS